MRSLIIAVVINIAFGSVMSFTRHPRAAETEDDLARRALLGGLLGNVLGGSVSDVVNQAEALPQNLQQNPLGTVTNAVGSLPLVGGLASNLLNTATGVAEGLPLVGGITKSLLNNPLGVAGGLPIVGNLLGTAQGLTDQRGPVLGLLNGLLGNVL
ncbi:hypothetical protein BgiMline_012504 [Biomphalaria glabrata]